MKKRNIGVSNGMNLKFETINFFNRNERQLLICVSVKGIAIKCLLFFLCKIFIHSNMMK